MSSSTAHERLARDHFLGLYEDGEIDRDALADGFRVYANGHDPRSVAEQARAAAVYREAFPDLAVTVEDSFATETRVALRGRVTGTHEGELFGVAPTGATVEVPVVAIYRIADGLLAESWTLVDAAGIRSQIDAARTDS